MLHAQGVEEVFLGKLIQRLPADPLNQNSQDNVIDVTILEGGIRSALQGLGAGLLDGSFHPGPRCLE